MPTRIKQLLARLRGKQSLRYILTLLFFLFLSRGLGMVRNLLLFSEQFVTKLEGDVILAATKVPDILVSLLIMGTISSSVLPVAARINQPEADPENERVSTYLNVIYLSLLAALLVFSLVVLLFTPTILRLTTSVDLQATFDDAGLFERYVFMTRILMLGPLAFATQGVFGIYLTLKERFAVYSWSGAIYNVGMIGGILLAGLGPRLAYAPAWGMMLGAGVASGVYLFEATRAGYRPLSLSFLRSLGERWGSVRSEFKATWAAFFPRIFLLNGLVVGNLLINTLGDGWRGQVLAVDIALSIQGVFFTLITAISTVFFPNIAKTFNNPRLSKAYFWKRLFTFVKGVGVVSVFGTLATVLLAPVVLWIFGLFGRSTELADYIVLLTRISALSIVFQSLVEILSKYIYVRERVWQPAIISLTGLLTQVVLTYTLRYGGGVDAGISVSWGVVANFLIVCGYMYAVTIRDRAGEAEVDGARLSN